MLGTKPIVASPPPRQPEPHFLYSQLSAPERQQALADVRQLCSEILAGLDVSPEIVHVTERFFGDAILYTPNGRLVRAITSTAR